MLHTAIFAAAVCAADASGQCSAPSYDFCCQIGTKCDCAKGAEDAGQCAGSKKLPIIGKVTSYKYCCQFATPCDCTKPGIMADKLSGDKLSGTWEGSVPFIIDVEATFDGSAKGHIKVNVKIAKDLIDCTTEDLAEDDSQITFPSVGTVGDCLGDGVRIDKKDPTKYFLIKNSDGTLTFKSDGYPALKMKKKSQIEV